MSPPTLRFWHWLHKWSSLISTLFMLLVCLTGLPLIFLHEINDLSGRSPVLQPVAADVVDVPLQQLEQAGQRLHPGFKPHVLIRDHEQPIWILGLANQADHKQSVELYLDSRTAQPLVHHYEQDFVWLLWKLHTDLLVGLPGTLFLGLMGGLMLVAIVSGVVLYAPFMRKLPFGTVRRMRSRHIRWLDWHNLLGIVIALWLTVVGLTGVINTLVTPMSYLWQQQELASMTAAYHGQAPVAQPLSAQYAVEAATRLLPDKSVNSVYYPDPDEGSPHHFIVLMQGREAVSQYLLTPVLVDARTGQVTDSRAMPWYLQMLMLSKPLHFGDYGGMPLKVLWTLLDIACIVVLGSGLYLWWRKHRLVHTQAGQAIDTVFAEEQA
ncbi:putative iron-regulated membrane protein [Chitinivorax tropicus]|uniref:Putative iron-regulated membrane protein n=1 Tax=Chitinivorax tropicus TaxID=714531 RepID=A0A840MGR7_9PROT|nr:PepSY-associated TM helix domain-containing protein [Chitinivorax tropicus]MBB5018424.1 putative iron-regulated membrane protein [Chitinivorax tropicus]